MESKEIQAAVKNKYENGDEPTKIFRDLGGVMSLQTIKLWIKMIRETGSINLAYSPGRPRAIRTKSNILKVKQRMAQKKKKVSTRKFRGEVFSEYYVKILVVFLTRKSSSQN